MSARVAPEAAPALRAAGEVGPDSAEHLRIVGLTGVDVELAIAGPGSRSYAFLIDWQLRVLLALAWFFAGWLIEHGPGLGGTRQVFAYTVVLPAVCIYLFYHPVLEVLMHGRTPGKRRAGLRIVTRSGGTPGIGALLMRNVFRLIDSLPAFYVIGLLCCFMSAQRVRIGDLAAGTLLIVDPGTSQAALDSLGGALAGAATGELSPAAAELVAELLERWGSLQPERRCALARTLLARIDDTAAAPLRDGWTDAQLHARLRELAQPPVRTRAAGRA